MVNNVENNAGNRGNEYSPLTIDIKERQKFICDQFSRFYRERDYKQFQSGDLLPRDDKTVIFTGATITPLKNILQEGVQSPGFFMIQKCLRVKRLDQIFDLNVYPDWTHYFTMCGILAAPGQAEKISDEAYKLLTNRLEVSKNNLLIEASSKDQELSDYWKNQGVKIAEDTRPEGYYRWHYGIPNMHGRGINLLLRFNEKDLYRDLGNVISIEDDNGKLMGYEFGFGLESLLSKMCGFKKPMEASIVSSVIPYEEGLKEKFVDVLVAAVVIYHSGIKPGRGREKHVLKKIVKGLSFLRRKMNMSLEQIKNYGNAFEEAEFTTTNGSTDKLLTGIISYENQISKYYNYAANQVHAHKLRNDMGENLLAKLRREGENMGISQFEMEEIINKVYI